MIIKKLAKTKFMLWGAAENFLEDLEVTLVTGENSLFGVTGQGRVW